MLLHQRGLALLLLSLCLASCATVSEQYQDMNHNRIYGIDCSGRAVPLSACYNKAKQLCPTGYTLLANQAELPANQLPADLAVVTQLPGFKKGITVRCQTEA